MNFLFVCGGTAGHINPALAIAEEMRGLMPDSKIKFVGSGRDLEKKLIPQAGYELINIKMTGLNRGITLENVIHNLKTAKNLLTAGGEAHKLLMEFRPDAVIGTGGYICYPVLKKAAQLCIPTVIHESNAIPGLTTKLLSTTADKVLVSFPGLEKEYRRPERVVFTGTPVRGGFSTYSKAEQRAVLGSEKPLVVSFWGSLGARKMNESMAEFISLNIKGRRFNHIHATGGGSQGITDMKARLKNLGAPDNLPDGIQLREYIDDMQAVMAAADLILCRAGASTLAELTVMAKPAVLVPSPYVTNNHQEENAKQLEKAGGAVMLLEKECTGRVLFDTVAELLSNEEKLEKMSASQKALSAPEAAKKIAELIISLC